MCEEVINFWFGGDNQLNYKTKWFPSNEKRDTQSKSQQELTDYEIHSRFKSHLTMAINGELDSWKSLSFQSCLALIMYLY